MLVDQTTVELGGPRPAKYIDQQLLIPVIGDTKDACQCGGSCGGNCQCGGNCGSDCGCGTKDLSIPEKTEQAIKTAVATTEATLKKASPKYVTNENMLKLAIGLSLGAALLIYLKK
jgi:hypothetical protein